MSGVITLVLGLIAVLLGGAIGGAFLQAGRKNVDIWLGAYIRQSWRRVWQKGPPRKEIIFCWVDHFEPMWNDAPPEVQQARMEAWMHGYPRLAERHRDSNGRVVQHTWFYPGEDFYDSHIEQLKELCQRGYGEIEFHHHHHFQDSDGLQKQFAEAFQHFARHGLLSDAAGNRRYCFIHGNMGLDNARGPEWCGVNDELTLLGRSGCYADFSYPVAPCESQTSKINSIYYVKDDPDQPKSQEDGVDVRVGGEPWGDLMMIQGPLALNWRKRKYGILPTIENGEIQQSNPGTPSRVDTWVRQHIHVRGRPEWIFVKISCHGAPEDSHDCCLGDRADAMLSYLEKRYHQSEMTRLHYVTAREMYNIIKAAEAGHSGNPHEFRDFAVTAPPYMTRGSQACSANDRS